MLSSAKCAASFPPSSVFPARNVLIVQLASKDYIHNVFFVVYVFFLWFLVSCVFLASSLRVHKPMATWSSLSSLHPAVCGCKASSRFLSASARSCALRCLSSCTDDLRWSDVVASGNLLLFAIENGHWNSGFSPWIWWFSIFMLVYQRVASSFCSRSSSAFLRFSSRRCLSLPQFDVGATLVVWTFDFPNSDTMSHLFNSGTWISVDSLQVFLVC